MSNEEKAPRAKQVFFIANVTEKFETKKDIETHLLENPLADDEVILKGREVETRASVAIV